MTKSRLPIALSLLLSSALTATASEVRVWGDVSVIDTYDTTRAILTVPAALASKNVIAVKSALSFAVALTEDKLVYVWGKMPTLDGLPIDLTNIPTAVQGHAIQINLLSNFAIVALLDSGEMIFWGLDVNGQVSLAPTTTGFLGVGRGESAGVAWTIAGIPTVWGNDAPKVPTGTLVADAIVLRDGVLYRRRSDNQVLSFGNMFAYSSLVPPVPVITATKIAVGSALDVAFAIRPDETIAAWGNNTAGLTTVPAGLTGVTDVAGGNLHALARSRGGLITTWGSGVSGGLAVPTDLTQVRLIAAGWGFSVAVRSQAPTAIAWADSAKVIASDPIGTVIGRLTAVDHDPGDTITYSVVSGAGDTDNARVVVVGNEVRVAGVLPAGPGQLAVRVRGTDESGASTEVALTATLTAAPKSPESDSKSSSRCGLGLGTGLILTLMLSWIHLRRSGQP